MSADNIHDSFEYHYIIYKNQHPALFWLHRQGGSQRELARDLVRDYVTADLDLADEEAADRCTEDGIGFCDTCGEEFDLGSRADHCWICGQCNEHCYQWKECLDARREEEENFGSCFGTCATCLGPNGIHSVNCPELYL